MLFYRHVSLQVKQSKKKENLKVTCDESKKEDEVSENTSGSTTHMGNLNRLTFSFFDQDCTHLAKALLGKVIVRNCKNSILRAMIVETEAYLGGDDKASHSYGGKKTKRNAAMFMPPGTSYVYYIYGTYCCMNISSRGQ